jgi:hypothetical protein
MPKRAPIEMGTVDLATGWERLPGLVGIEIKMLSNDLDETAKTGGRTRLVRFAPGAHTTEAFVHDYWEEVYVIEGQLGPLGTKAGAAVPTYSCRPPGTSHGPFQSETGCLMLEIQYYAKT